MLQPCFLVSALVLLYQDLLAWYQGPYAWSHVQARLAVASLALSSSDREYYHGDPSCKQGQ